LGVFNKAIRIALKPWMEFVIWEIAEAKGKNFSWTANYLMEVKLNDLGFYREDYEPDMKDIMKPKKKLARKDGVIPFDPRLSGTDLYMGKCKIIPFEKAAL
jgi:hypothetical protein